MQYRHRLIEAGLKTALQKHAVLGVSGPLGAGKTTLLVNSLPDYEYVSFSDRRSLQQYYEDPKRFIRLYRRKTIFDEIQHAPELITALCQRSTERSARSVLVSSCLFDAIRGIPKDAICNIKMLRILGYQQEEIISEMRESAIYRGSFPALVENRFQHSQSWFADYIEASILKSLPTIGQVSNQNEFLRLLHLLAAHTSEGLNLSHYAHLLSVDVKTIKRWIELLASAFIIFLIPPYHQSFGKRVMKSPKLYFYDTGLVAYLTGIETQKQYEFGPMAAKIYENYIVCEILKKIFNQNLYAKLYYLSTNHGVTVELIIEYEDSRHFITIHNNETFRMRMVNALEKFMSPEDRGYLLYNGIDMPYRNNIQVMHFSTYLHSQ